MHKLKQVYLLCFAIFVSSINTSALAEQTVQSVQTEQSTQAHEKDPQPLPAPLHSQIPYSESRLFGARTGKAFKLDPSYRGNPALPTQVPTITFGTTNWSPGAKKKLAINPILPSPNNKANVQPINIPQKTKAVIGEDDLNIDPTLNPNTNLQNAEATSIVNLRMLTPQKFKSVDIVYAYPYPPRPPRPIEIGPLPESEKQLKEMTLSSGYSARFDLEKPYPSFGWRWIHAYQTALKKSHLHEPHTLVTCYPWVNKMFPYILSECRELNRLEEERKDKYAKIITDYESSHVELESQAAGRGLFPIQIKLDAKGVGQSSLPTGNWWLTATRRLPGLKFYWQIPISCEKDKVVNVQLTEANALLIQGSW